MGGFVDFRCSFCKYEENDIGIGHGKKAFPFLALYRCDNCQTIGSTWVYPDKLPHCSQCYHDAVTILPEDTRRVMCPKCGEPAKIAPKEGSWD